MLKNLFLLLLGLLVVFSQWMTYRQEAPPGAVPSLYWSTVINPMHRKYAILFRQWLSNQGQPDFDVMVDVNSYGLQKTIIQGVSGVAADVLNVNNHHVHIYHSIGLLEALDGFPDIAARVSELFRRAPPLEHYLVREGRLYAVPQRIHATAFMVNLDALRAHGMPPPPLAPSLDQFEAMAREFCGKANQGRSRRDAFFADRINLDLLLHAAGLSFLNETGTAAVPFDEPRNALMERAQRWVYDEHLLPTPAEWLSFNVEQSLSPAFALFCRGQFAAISGGRWLAIFMREQKKPVTIGTMLPPNQGYPVTDYAVGGVAMYRNSKNKERAASFMRFFLTSNYQRALAYDADGLPPDPRSWNDPQLLRPAQHTNEWAFHEPFTNIFHNHTAAPEESPYLQQTEFGRARNPFALWEARHVTAGEAWRLFSESFHTELLRALKHKPTERPRYEAALKRQALIDGLKRTGGSVPADWVANPFLRKYYKDQGRYP
jgi:multiple sugar transport system substrate-binding protein